MKLNQYILYLHTKINNISNEKKNALVTQPIGRGRPPGPLHGGPLQGIAGTGLNFNLFYETFGLITL